MYFGVVHLNLHLQIVVIECFCISEILSELKCEQTLVNSVNNTKSSVFVFFGHGRGLLLYCSVNPLQ